MAWEAGRQRKCQQKGHFSKEEHRCRSEVVRIGSAPDETDEADNVLHFPPDLGHLPSLLEDLRPLALQSSMAG